MRIDISSRFSETRLGSDAAGSVNRVVVRLNDAAETVTFSADIVAYQYHQEFREQEFNVWQALGSSTPARAARNTPAAE
jgi:hypothetical protein